MEVTRIEELLNQKKDVYKQALEQIQQLDKEYNNKKDALFTHAIELQGQIKLLQDEMPKDVVIS